MLETFEEAYLQFKPWVIEDEIQVGLFRVPVPNYDRCGFREAFVLANSGMAQGAVRRDLLAWSGLNGR